MVLLLMSFAKESCGRGTDGVAFSLEVKDCEHGKQKRFELASKKGREI